LRTAYGHAGKTGWKFLEKFEIWKIIKQLKYMLGQVIKVIVSCREAQTRRRIQLYLDDRSMDEFAKAGKRMARKDIND
jgi:hypothetical protein